jgi:hypothetical protein
MELTKTFRTVSTLPSEFNQTSTPALIQYIEHLLHTQ